MATIVVAGYNKDKHIMKIAIKRFMRHMALWLLSFSLFALASIAAINLTVLNQNYIKRSLVNAQTYENIVPTMLNLATSSTGVYKTNQPSTQTLQSLVPVVTKSVTPEFVQTTTESIIDGTFAWLKGNTPEPFFTIETSAVKASLQRDTADYLQARLQALPVCDANISRIDPLTTDCRPPQVSESVANAAASELVQSMPLLGKSEITASSLGMGDVISRNPIVKHLPTGYKVSTVLPYAFAVISLICAIIIIFASTLRHKGWRRVGHSFVLAGLLLVLAGLLAAALTKRFGTMTLGDATQQQFVFIDTIFTPLANTLSLSVSLYTLYFGVIYAIIGALCYALSHKLRIDSAQSDTDNTPIQTNTSVNNV